MTLNGILRAKQLRIASASDGNRIDQLIRNLAYYIHQQYCGRNYVGTEMFMEELRKAAAKEPHTFQYDETQKELIKRLVDCHAAERYGYSLTYRVLAKNNGVVDFLQKGFADIAVVDEIKKNVNARVDEIYYNVNLEDLNGRSPIHVDVVYRIGSVAYFVLIFMNRSMLDQTEFMVNRVNKTLITPANRLKTNVSIVISPSVQLYDKGGQEGVITIMRKYTKNNVSTPIVAPFNNLRAIIPNIRYGTQQN